MRVGRSQDHFFVRGIDEALASNPALLTAQERVRLENRCGILYVGEVVNVLRPHPPALVDAQLVWEAVEDSSISSASGFRRGPITINERDG